jgi:putative tryptophan/tyrosine transport system substrate-binding protein
MRHIGIIIPASSTDMKFQIQVRAFEQELKKFGWTIGQNVQIETRWATANLNEVRRSAAELAALKPDVILAHGSSTVGPMQQATNTIPIVFPVAGDPVAGGFVESLARPGGNITGFAIFEYNIGAKWLELLKQIAPRVTRAAVLPSWITRCTRSNWRDSICWADTRGRNQTIECARCCFY